MMRRRGSLFFLCIFCVVVLTNCTTLTPYPATPSDETVTKAQETKTNVSLKATPAAEGRSEKKPGSEALSLSNEGEKGKAEGEEESVSSDGNGSTNQELIDSALELCQASNDFWEQGDLDSAVAALDDAYALILKVKVDGDQALLQQKEDLRFTISKRIVEVYASRFSATGGDFNAIPLVINDHVRRELDSFKGRERDFFMAAYSRSGRYRPAIVRALKDAGMPEELSWLPLIESGYKVRALSRARALGMWQFIASTGYRYGLKRDQWVDERMDARKSTDAAIAYLRELHQMFGDWTTALAAYNCGETGVMNRIRTQRINYLDNFWDLYEKLPNETARYVPRLLAVLHIVKEPEAHGMLLPPLDDEIEAEEVTFHKQVLVKEVAARLGLDPVLLQEMNAELRHDVTPDAPYAFKVPVGQKDRLIAVIDQVPSHKPPARYAYGSGDTVIHTVRSGDTLSAISKRYRTSVAAIMAENNLKKNHILRVGAKLVVPAGGTASSLRVSGAQSAKSTQAETPTRYVVRKGDTLWQIAGQFNTTVRQIQAMNGLRDTRLSLGQVLMIPPAGGAVAPVATASQRTYTVQGGDSPYLIAKKHEMALAELLRLNNLTTSCTIFPGQSLAVK